MNALAILGLSLLGLVLAPCLIATVVISVTLATDAWWDNRSAFLKCAAILSIMATGMVCLICGAS